MNNLKVLILPFFWSLKNEALHFSKTFYRRLFLYLIMGTIFMILFTYLLNTGMTKLKSLSPELFNILLIKAYSLMFLIIFFVQIINGFLLSLNTFYNAKELETLLISPVDRRSLFISRLMETYLKASWMLLVFGIPILLSIGMLKQADLLFYLLSFFSLAFFLFIPLGISIAGVIFITRYVHARRLKNISVATLIISAVLFITVLRLLRPEYLVNPELFANLTIFITELKTPSFILLPSRWLSEVISRLSEKKADTDTLLFLSAIISTSYIIFLLTMEIFKKYFYSGWERLQEGVIKSSRLSLLKLQTLVEKIFSWTGQEIRALIKKEIISYIRDSRNLQELPVLFALIIIYAFSISALPLNWEGYAERLRYMASLFNTGIIMIIISALSARVVYPLLSEGPSTWLIKTSPVSIDRYICTRYFLFLLPLFSIGEGLIIFSIFFISVQKAYQIGLILTTGLSTSSILSITFLSGFSKKGIINSLTDSEKPRAPAIYMLISLFIIGINLLFMIIPVLDLFRSETGKINTNFLNLSYCIIVIINTLITFLSLQQSIKKYRRLEI